LTTTWRSSLNLSLRPSILFDEFLEEVKGLKQKNLAAELLSRLLDEKVKVVARRNYVQSKKFSEMLEQSIVKYNNRAIKTTKIIEEEVAFYDALAASQ
jgi:type I restriction enzyme, R subunit